MQIRYKCPKINTIMYKSSVMLLLYITMKIISSGKESSHKYTACKLSHIFVWYSLVMYIKSVHYCLVHKLDYPALRLPFSSSSSFYLSAFCPFSVHPMYLLTEECSYFLQYVLVNLQNQPGLFVVMQCLVLEITAFRLYGVYKIWHCQSWSSYTMVYEYPKTIYLLTNISLWTKTLKVLKSPKHVIQNIYIFKAERTAVIEIIIGSTSNTVFSPKNDDIK